MVVFAEDDLLVLLRDAFGASALLLVECCHVVAGTTFLGGFLLAWEVSSY